MVKEMKLEKEKNISRSSENILPHNVTTSLAREMYQYCLGEPHSQALMWGEESLVHSVHTCIRFNY